jgi:hypothetical protein
LATLPCNTIRCERRRGSGSGTAIRFYNCLQVYIAIADRCAIDMRPERDKFDAGSTHVLDGLLGAVFVSLPLVIARLQCAQGGWVLSRGFMLSAWRGEGPAA